MRIESGDYTLTPAGPLGSRTAVAEADGRYLGTFDTAERALEFVRERMEAERFWPTVWWVSDHGNAWPLDPVSGAFIESEGG